MRETGGAASRDRKEKLTSPPGRMSWGKKIALTEIRAGGGRMWGLAEVLQWDVQIVTDILITGQTQRLSILVGRIYFPTQFRMLSDCTDKLFDDRHANSFTLS